MTDPIPTTAQPAQRPYVTPTLVVHGDVQTLTQKQGPAPDQAGGSFIDQGDA